jgi:uncharacterized protein YndB with AHSA1/START domain
MMRNLGLAALAALFLSAAPAAASDPVRDLSYRDATGHRVMKLSAVVRASLDDAWAAFTTDAGYQRWAAPVAHITLGNDGMMETSYDPAARIGVSDTIRNRIVAYEPERLLVIQNVHVPKGAPFDPVLTASIRTIITFAAVDKLHTRVTVSQVGYGDGAGYETMYGHFRAGNAFELRQLAQSFVTGPVDWSKTAMAANASVGAAPAPAGPAIHDSSYVDASGARVLREFVVVDGPRAAVWAAFTDDRLFAKWAVPVVHITPGNGGLIEFGLGPNAKIGDPMNVKNRIDVFLPGELLAMHNEFVPAGGPFDPPTFATVRTLLSFEDAGEGRTKVTETVVGFGAGAKYDQLYDHLRGGNAEYLMMLAVFFGNLYVEPK